MASDEATVADELSRRLDLELTESCVQHFNRKRLTPQNSVLHQRVLAEVTQVLRTIRVPVPQFHPHVDTFKFYTRCMQDMMSFVFDVNSNRDASDEAQDNADDQPDGDEPAESQAESDAAGTLEPAATKPKEESGPNQAHMPNRQEFRTARRAARKADITNRVDQFMARLQTAESELIAGWSNNEILLHELYGSLCVGLGSSSSDIDLALLMQDATAQLWAHLHSREILAKVKKAFKKTYGRFQTLPILTTRVPIIIVTHLQSGITIDISVADSTNPFKTMIMRELYEREPCALMLTVAVKHFAKRHGVGDASKGMLSSYAWALLMIQFLQLRFAENGSPILPAAELPALLQQCLDSGISVPTEVRCQIGMLWAPSEAEMTCNHAHASLGRLFLEFLAYYGGVTDESAGLTRSPFDYAKQASSIRAGAVVSKSTMSLRAANIELAIQDPIDPHDNVGRAITLNNLQIVKSVCRQECMRLLLNTKSSLAYPPWDSVEKNKPARMQHLAPPVAAPNPQHDVQRNNAQLPRQPSPQLAVSQVHAQPVQLPQTEAHADLPNNNASQRNRFNKQRPPRQDRPAEFAPPPSYRQNRPGNTANQYQRNRGPRQPQAFQQPAPQPQAFQPASHPAPAPPTHQSTE